jgi:hypothetical protein
MEDAIRGVIHDMFEDYVFGLDKQDLSQFPIVFRNLQLKPRKVNEVLEEDTPFSLEKGMIGMVKIDPGWSGNVDIEASGIKLNLNFSPMKAAQLAMRPDNPDVDTEQIFMTGAYAPPAVQPPLPINVAPRFCEKHDTSEKRKKCDPRPCTCKSCGLVFTSTYADILLCSGCSDKEQRCIICGAGAQKACSYIPPNAISNGNAQVGRASFGGPGGPPGKSGSMQVGRGSFGGATPSDLKPRQSDRASFMPPNSAQTPSTPQPAPKQQAVPPRRPPPPRPRRPAQEDDDDPIAGFFNSLNCTMFNNDDEYETVG